MGKIKENSIIVENPTPRMIEFIYALKQRKEEMQIKLDEKVRQLSTPKKSF